MSFFSKKMDPLHVLLLDINSSSIGAAILEVIPHHPVSIQHTLRRPLRFLNHSDSKNAALTLTETLKDICLNIQKEYFHTTQGNSHTKKYFDEIHIVLSSPYITSSIVTVEKNFKGMAKITHSLIREIAHEKIAEYSNDTYLVETKIMDIRLNGYKIGNPVGQKAQNIDLKLYSSLAHSSLIQGIERTFGSFFGATHMEYHSFTVSAYMALRSVYQNLENAIFLNITGETTELIGIKDKELTTTKLFPCGIRTITKDIALALHIPLEEAYTRIVRICRNDYEESSFKETQEALVQSVKKWTHMCSESLSESLPAIPAETTFMFIAEESISEIFTHALKGVGFGTTITEERITPLFDDSFISFCTYAPMATQDPIFSLEAVSVLSMH